MLITSVAAVWQTLIVGGAFLVAGGIVTLWTIGWHIKRPRWVRDAKIAVSMLGAIALMPAMAMTFVFGILSMAPALVVFPFISATNGRAVGAS